MLHLEVFTDGSVNTQLKVGYGAYLIVIKNRVQSIDSLQEKVKIKRF